MTNLGWTDSDDNGFRDFRLPQTEYGGGSGGYYGGRYSYRSPQRTWATPQHVGPFQSVQVLGRLSRAIKAGALGTALGSAISPVLDLSQANYPGLRNDLEYQPKGVLDIGWRSSTSVDVTVGSVSEPYEPKTVWLEEPVQDQTPYHDQSAGSVSWGDIARKPSAWDPQHLATGKGVADGAVIKTPQVGSPVWKNTQLQVALSEYEHRLELNAKLNSDWKHRNEAMVQQRLAELEYEQRVREIMAIEPAPTVSIEVRPSVGDSITWRLAYRETQDENVFRRRRSDQKIPPWYSSIMHTITRTLGAASEVVDVMEAMAWNLYSLDGRGRAVQTMLKYNRNMAFSFREYALGRARLDTWGFVTDAAIQQWSDAAYAFQAREQDRLALQLGWKAPVGITSHYRGMMRGTKEWEDDVSSSWIRSQSRWFRSKDVWRARRVQSLWYAPRSNAWGLPSPDGLQQAT